MRYDTAGDYYYKEDGTLKFEIADTGNTLYNKILLVHEIVEQALTEDKGITADMVDQFDFMFEKERQEGYHDLDEEPGMDGRCPYQREHLVATAMEMIILSHAGKKWIDYDEKVVTL